MSWATWDQATIASLICIVGFLILGRLPTSRLCDFAASALREFALISALYAVWRLARQLPLTHEAGALGRARDIDHLQVALHVPTEIAVQHFVLHHDWLARAVNAYYATAHVPALIVFLIWLFVRHRDRYPHWRNGLALLTLGCLVIRFIRVAPPRFIDDLGFVDLSTRYGLGVYGPVGTGVSDQFAAMPSIHVGWAAVVALGVFFSTRSKWRWVIVMHLPITVFVVAATGHHWWLDGVVAVLLLVGGLWIDSLVRRRVTRSTVPTDPHHEDPSRQAQGSHPTPPAGHHAARI